MWISKLAFCLGKPQNGSCAYPRYNYSAPIGSPPSQDESGNNTSDPEHTKSLTGPHPQGILTPGRYGFQLAGRCCWSNWLRWFGCAHWFPVWWLLGGSSTTPTTYSIRTICGTILFAETTYLKEFDSFAMTMNRHVWLSWCIGSRLLPGC